MTDDIDRFSHGSAAGWVDAPGRWLVGTKAKYPHCRTYLPSDIDALRAWLDRRRQLVEARTAEKNRRHTAPAAVIGSIDDHIAWLDEQIERLDQAIEDAATASTMLAEPLERLRAIPGVGRVVALTVLTHLWAAAPRRSTGAARARALPGRRAAARRATRPEAPRRGGGARRSLPEAQRRRGRPTSVARDRASSRR
jgi:hypothetical protein